jgi:hypothetical protein
MCQIIGPFFIVNSINPQVMRCIICHPTPVNVDSNRKNKRLVSYNTRYGTSALKKHVIDKHVKEYRRWGLFMVQKSKDGGDQRQATKKRKTIPPQIINFFNNQRPYNKFDHAQHFWKIWYCTSQKIIDHCLLLKTHGLRHLILHQCG